MAHLEGEQTQLRNLITMFINHLLDPPSIDY